ncbi:peptidase [Maricaulis sp. CAU 1757]
MTYCVALRLDRGLVFMSDTRTNAGVDNISMFRKLFTWSIPGERVISVMTAGNLATTQAVVSLLEERLKAPAERSPSIMEAPTLFQIANIVGDTLRECVERQSGGPDHPPDPAFNATLIVGGQIAGQKPAIFMVYPEGNFIEASDDTPYFQIGETKYGRPILVRVFDSGMSLEAAVKMLCLSFDSTIKANLSVGMPLDFHVYTADSLETGEERRILEDDTYFREVSADWHTSLRAAFEKLPDYEF